MFYNMCTYVRLGNILMLAAKEKDDFDILLNSMKISRNPNEKAGERESEREK